MSSPVVRSRAAQQKSAFKQPGAISKVTGAAIGTALEAWANVFGFSPNVTHALELSAPALAVFIGATAHYCVEILKHQVFWIGLHFLLRRAKRRVERTTTGSISHEEATANVLRLEGLINELLANGANSIQGLWR
jgi:hypothetical protein